MEWFLLRKVSLFKRYYFNRYEIKTQMEKWCYNKCQRNDKKKWN